MGKAMEEENTNPIRRKAMEKGTNTMAKRASMGIKEKAMEKATITGTMEKEATMGAKRDMPKVANEAKDQQKEIKTRAKAKAKNAGIAVRSATYPGTAGGT